MKKLTMNRLSLAGIRANRKDYGTLALSVFLAVFFTVGTFLGLDAIYQRRRAELAAIYGTEEAILFDTEVTPEALTGQALARKAGSVTLVGTLEGFPVGYYDDTAQTLLARQCLQGHLPRQSGEVALDRRVKERLYPDAAIGDTLLLSIEGRTNQTKEFRLVGVLRGQHEDDTQDAFADIVPEGSLNFPQVLLFDAEGMAPLNRHVVLTFPLGGSLEKLKSAYPAETLAGVQPSGGLYLDKPMFNTFELLKDAINMGTSLMLAGFCLLLGSIIGIFSAVSGQYQRKETQYALLRTIGATRQQIRDISSRDALVLTLLTAPAGGLCAIGFVELLRLLFPESLPERPRFLWALAGIALAAVLVWIAARLPALFSGFQSGDGLRIRKLRSRKAYSLPELWNARCLRAHPFRAAASILLITLLYLSAVLSVNYAVNSWRNMLDPEALGDQNLELRTTYYASVNNGCFTAEPAYHLTPEAVDTLKAMPGVASADGIWYGTVMALTDHVGSYYPMLGLSNEHLMQYRKEVLTQRGLEEMGRSSYQRAVAIEQALKSYLNTDKIPYTLQLVVVSDIAALQDSLLSGSIDVDAINAGTAVLVNMPTMYLNEDAYGYQSISSSPRDKVISVIENDQIALGETLSLFQLYMNAAEAANYDLTGDDPEALPFDKAVLRQASPKVCGMVDENFVLFPTGAIITTPEGIRNMGLSYVQTHTITVTLSPFITNQEKDAVLDKLETLACQEDHLAITDTTNLWQAFAASNLRHILFRCAITAMLLLLTLMEIQGSLRWLIRSEQKNLGILRAVGAETRTLESLWRRQIYVYTVAGLPISAAIYGISQMPRYTPALLDDMRYNCSLPLFLGILIVSALLVLALNLAFLRGTMKRMEQQNILDSIRDE